MTESKSDAHTDQKNDILKRRLAETEARLLSRLLLSAEQVLDPQYYDILAKKFEDNSALDILEVERQVSQKAKEEAESLREIVEAAKSFRDNKRRLDTIQSDLAAEPQEEHGVPQAYQQMIVSREKLFSLIDSGRIQENFQQQIS